MTEAASAVAASCVLVTFAALAADSEQQKLDRLLSRTTRVKVYVMDEKSRKVYESSAKEDIRALKAASRLKTATEHGFCMCDGDPQIELFAAQKSLGFLSNQHGADVRFPTSAWDSPLADPEAWLRWFDDRNIPQARAEVNEAAIEAARGQKEEAAWLAAMPEALKPFWPANQAAGTHAFGQGPRRDQEKAALARALPDTTLQIQALFAWYGQGAGPWSGYPSYEEQAEELLLTYPTEALIRAVGADASEHVLFGAARLFAEFWRVREKDGAALKPELRRRLLERALKSPDADVQKRARAALGAPAP
jgi:hypothetical protein